MSIAAAHQALRLRLSRGVRHHSTLAMHHGQRAPDSLDRADRADARNGARASLSSSALVTGASGFVGSAIAAALRTRGQCRVVAFVRSSSPRTNLDPGDAVVVGDLNDRAALAAALKGVRFLFHAAADYRLWARDPRRDHAQQRRWNPPYDGGGAESGRRAHRLYQQRRDPEASSRARWPRGDIGSPRTRRSAPTSGARSLRRAPGRGDDRRATACRRSSSIPRRRSARATSSRRRPAGIIVEAACGRMPAYVDTGLNLVHVDDVAAGHLLALRRGRIGERYILGGENVLPRRHAGATSRIWSGRRPPRLEACRARPLYPIASWRGVDGAAAPAASRSLTVDGLTDGR